MVAVEASLVLNEIATEERVTPGQNEAESRYVAAPCDTPMYLFQLDFWAEAFPRHWHEEWGIATPDAGSGGLGYRELATGKRGTDRIRCEMNCGTPSSERQSVQFVGGLAPPI